MSRTTMRVHARPEALEWLDLFFPEYIDKDLYEAQKDYIGKTYPSAIPYWHNLNRSNDNIRGFITMLKTELANAEPSLRLTTLAAHTVLEEHLTPGYISVLQNISRPNGIWFTGKGLPNACNVVAGYMTLITDRAACTIAGLLGGTCVVGRKFSWYAKHWAGKYSVSAFEKDPTFGRTIDEWADAAGSEAFLLSQHNNDHDKAFEAGQQLCKWASDTSYSLFMVAVVGVVLFSNALETFAKTLGDRVRYLANPKGVVGCMPDYIDMQQTPTMKEFFHFEDFRRRVLHLSAETLYCLAGRAKEAREARAAQPDHDPANEPKFLAVTVRSQIRDSPSQALLLRISVCAGADADRLLVLENTPEDQQTLFSLLLHEWGIVEIDPETLDMLPNTLRLKCGYYPCSKFQDSAEPAFMQCSQCKTVKYCSADCQKKDWVNRSHKEVCKRQRVLFEAGAPLKLTK